MASSSPALQIQPGKGLGFLFLGAALHDVLTRLRTQSQVFRAISIAYSQKSPLQLPVIVSLPHNGIRLRFDGPEQRLRLIEVLDFSKVSLSYRNTKSAHLATLPSSHSPAGSEKPLGGPSFRQIYDIFSVTFPGEYFAPRQSSKLGTYVLSYPGLAFSFPVEDSAWASTKSSDFVKILSSSSTSAARCLAIFSSGSWKEARAEYLVEGMSQLRPHNVSSRGAADDVERVRVRGRGRVQIQRRFSKLEVVLGYTSAQDLVATLGPPDAVYRKNDWRLSIHKRRTTSTIRRSENWDAPAPGTQYSDSDDQGAITDESLSDEEPAAAAGLGPEQANDCFYNYFRHGIDVYFSDVTHASPPLVPDPDKAAPLPIPPSGQRLVVTKLVLHANVPGSYSFNRYRRCRWVLDGIQPGSSSSSGSSKQSRLNSESRFAELNDAFRAAWSSSYSSEAERQLLERPMILNRGWNDSPGSSLELLGELDDSEITLPASSQRTTHAKGLAASMGNARLYGFPGMLFEVLANDAISSLTVY